ncbi:component of IIS longevity pathway SMK-1-domain-containing protein [Obelidium mucronatum]|nr:component of IIS longevity pathway SMK-1-domain-containing protein [Obelidium mucronatum]
MERQRVKVYQLDSEGVWEDKGTGSVAVNELVWIHVAYENPPEQDEKRPDLLLKTKIKRDVDFIRQQDTLIVWTEEDGTDMALSFQEQAGCNELWNTIRDIKRKLNGSPDGNIDNLPQTTEEEPVQDERKVGGLVLSKPSMASIKEIEEVMFASSKGAYGRGQLSRAVMQDNFIAELLPLLEMCEDMESLDELYSLSHIVKMIVFLNDSKIYEYLLQDEIFPSIIGLLEYDREYPSAKSNYRQQTSSAKFKQLLPIPDASISAKITQTYRLQFLRDTALARMLDDATFSAMNSMVFFNQVDIISWFVGAGEDYLSKVIGVLNEEDIGEEGLSVKRDDVVLFLHELSGVAKGMQVSLRANYYRTMAKLGLFAIFDYTLVHDDIKIRLAAAAILTSILDHDPSLVRSFCLAQLKQKQPQLLISLLIQRFLNDPDPGLQSQLCELIRTILETDEITGTAISASAVSSDSDVDDFLNLFYDKCVDSLVSPVLAVDSENLDSLESTAASHCSHICEILAFTVKSHSYRSKYYILGSAITSKILLLLRAKETYVKLAALRFFRTCIGMKDEFYNRHLLKHDVFGSILACFRATNGKYNLLNSACLDIFEFIRKENIKSLITNLVQSHKSQFADVTYVDTFKNLVLRYEQNQEVPSAGLGADDESSKPVEKAKPDGWGRMDNDEEAYFNDSDDEDSGSTDSATNSNNLPRSTTGGKTVPLVIVASGPPPSSGKNRPPTVKRSASPLGLVDYEDDDEEDDMFSAAVKRATSPISFISKNGSSSPSLSAKEGSPAPNNPSNGSGNASGKISFSLNKGGIQQQNPIIKRRRTDSFSGEDESGMDTN